MCKLSITKKKQQKFKAFVHNALKFNFPVFNVVNDHQLVILVQIHSIVS